MSSLPAPLTRFVGRETELAQAATLLAEARLLTLTGPGGAGKTRLALRLASTVAEDFADGVWFVDLSSLSAGQFVWDQVATTLGVTESGSGRPLTEAVGRYLAPRRALVLLDNCEHLVESAAEVAAELLAAAPELRLVATSREPLGVGGEVTWALPPLSDADGLELFSDRARQARPNFRLGDEDAKAVLTICRRLDGLPLAIELAAARTRAFAPADIAAGLRDRLELLPSGPRTAPARQATLQASFDWSYALLSDAERALLRQCSVFAGGFDLEAAIAVCPAGSLDVLAALVDRSLLLVQDDQDRGGPRYRMLEPIRQFAAKRLAEAGEVETIGTRHGDHYLRLAETAAPLLRGPDEDRWRARLRTEQDNLRASMAWSRDQGDPEALARMVSALILFWAAPGRMTEFGMWVDAAYDRVGDLSPLSAARILNLECALAVFSRRAFEKVPALAGEALTLARAAGDGGEEAFALGMLGLAAGLAGGADAMRPYVEQAMPLARSGGNALGMIYSLVAFMTMRLFHSDPEEGRRLAAEAVAVAEAGADRHNRLFASQFAGVNALVEGRLADAAQIFEGVVAAGRETNDSNFIHSLLGLAWVALFRGDFQAGGELLAEALEGAQKAGTDSISITSIDPLARWIRGWMELAGGDAVKASETLAVVVSVARSPNIARFASVPLVVLAEAQLALGQRDEAAAFLDEATSLASAGAMTWVLGRVARVRAELRDLEGDVKEAESLANEALGLAREAGDQLGLVDALQLLARLAAEQDSLMEAARLWAAAESLRAELGYVRFPIEQGPYEAALAMAKVALGPDEFASAWDEGAKLTVEEAIAYTARGRGERKRPTTGWASLTPSELEVARLVGQHLSNPQIAARLFVSRATVKTHLVHIFAKLGIESRSELVAEVIKRGIQPRPSRQG
jgi:predicted ATPase/DNA-binding CsgD family transcriptional regulator/tetratricopeptide (TPR) repeat protein